MPIYEYACPKCRVIFSFLSKRLRPDHPPACPKCGSKKMLKEVSRFSAPRGAKEPSADAAEGPDDLPADLDNPRLARAMQELEQDMSHMDENNPRHMAHLMRKMKEMLPSGMLPKELDVAIKRLEAGEDPEKIEEDMGDLLGDVLGGAEEEEGMGMGGGGSYRRDPGLYDY